MVAIAKKLCRHYNVQKRICNKTRKMICEVSSKYVSSFSKIGSDIILENRGTLHNINIKNYNPLQWWTYWIISQPPSLASVEMQWNRRACFCQSLQKVSFISNFNLAQFLLIKATTLVFCTECSETQVAALSLINWRKLSVLYCKFSVNGTQPSNYIK